ncbi:non-hydrolyzing UDP-N-acetylglucosamine 2-epimerase [Caulobacter soli]|uniref:non-hydrolyzing UDP-N-acetylglucosamine 2-epimerase n=1 Tax=Caulobacter soli TaxID=2708539 RepID=UPI0013EBABC3|nr:UDP-N-acetylglucosamine 2-epimerase (non-hydrolyzing) [Caulobacter soli]
MPQRRIFSVVGARPQFIKAGPVERAFKDHAASRSYIVHTGQHYDANMSEVFFEELQIPQPSFKLNISGGSHGEMTGRMLEALDRLFIDERPDGVLVYGDTNSTLAGALAASKLSIPVFHIEAGLRSFNRAMPEEINRVLTDHVSDLLFCPTAAAVENLVREGVTQGVYAVGDVMQDATQQAAARAETASTVLETLDLVGRPYVLCTIHRAENTNDLDRLRALLDYVRETAAGRLIVFPVHPRTRKICEAAGIGLEGFMPIDPAGYLDLQRLISGCELVCCDSGGLQKEAYFHRRPCVTLRDETEWVETIDAGWNRLWRTPDFVSPRRGITDYGDGHAARRIVEHIDQWFATA